jgi:hypothetical protein
VPSIRQQREVALGHRQAVDWYHAKEHLHRVADLDFGEGSTTGQQWDQTQLEISFG